MRQAWGSLDSLVGRLRAAYEEHGGQPEANPFAARIVRGYLRDTREVQSRARGITYEKKKRRRTVKDSSDIDVFDEPVTGYRVPVGRDEEEEEEVAEGHEGVEDGGRANMDSASGGGEGGSEQQQQRQEQQQQHRSMPHQYPLGDSASPSVSQGGGDEGGTVRSASALQGSRLAPRDKLLSLLSLSPDSERPRASLSLPLTRTLTPVVARGGAGDKGCRRAGSWEGGGEGGSGRGGESVREVKLELRLSGEGEGEGPGGDGGTGASDLRSEEREGREGNQRQQQQQQGRDELKEEEGREREGERKQLPAWMLPGSFNAQANSNASLPPGPEQQLIQALGEGAGQRGGGDSRRVTGSERQALVSASRGRREGEGEREREKNEWNDGEERVVTLLFGSDMLARVGRGGGGEGERGGAEEEGLGGGRGGGVRRGSMGNNEGTSFPVHHEGSNATGSMGGGVATVSGLEEKGDGEERNAGGEERTEGSDEGSLPGLTEVTPLMAGQARESVEEECGQQGKAQQRTEGQSEYKDDSKHPPCKEPAVKPTDRRADLPKGGGEKSKDTATDAEKRDAEAARKGIMHATGIGSQSVVSAGIEGVSTEAKERKMGDRLADAKARKDKEQADVAVAEGCTSGAEAQQNMAMAEENAGGWQPADTVGIAISGLETDGAPESEKRSRSQSKPAPQEDKCSSGHVPSVTEGSDGDNEGGGEGGASHHRRLGSSGGGQNSASGRGSKRSDGGGSGGGGIGGSSGGTGNGGKQNCKNNTNIKNLGGGGGGGGSSVESTAARTVLGGGGTRKEDINNGRLVVPTTKCMAKRPREGDAVVPSSEKRSKEVQESKLTDLSLVAIDGLEHLLSCSP